MFNDKGSILAITLAFALVFTMFGLSTIYLSGLQGETTEKEIGNNQAFWLAEAGIQQAFWNLPAKLGPFSDALISGTFTSQSTAVTPVRWTIDSTGSVYTQNRKVRVEVGANVLKAITTTGTLRAPGGEGPDNHVFPNGSYEENATFTFESIFKVSEATLKGLATLVSDKKADQNNVIDGITWFQGNLKITNMGGWKRKGILVVEGNLTMEGGTYDGIIWVKGSAKMINGKDLVNGAVFVADDSKGQTTINGNCAINFKPAAIDEAFGYFGNGYPQTVHNIISWQEVD